MRKIPLLFGFAFLLCSLHARSQNVAGNFVVFTFEDAHKISQHGLKRSYWVVPVDSIRADAFPASVLLLHNFTRTDLDSCCRGRPLTPFEFAPGVSFHFEPSYGAGVDTLERLIRRHRKAVQRLTKRWETGQREIVKVFATPLTARFCAAPISNLGRFHFGYTGCIYVPQTRFRAFDTFWGTQQAALVLNRDYSRLNFNIVE